MPAKRKSKKRRQAKSSQASKIRTLQRKVGTLINSQEKKFKNNNIMGVVNSTVGIFNILNSTTQGPSDDGQREGDKIHCVFLMIRGSMRIDTSVDPLKTNTMRVVLLIDREVTVGTASDVLAQTGNAFSPFQAYSKDNRSDFTVLHSQLISWGGRGPSIIGFEIYKKLNLNVQYNNGSSTLASNCISILFISNDGGANPPEVLYTSRVFYTDS